MMNQRESNDTTFWQLDYGGFSDSANRKVSVWGAIIMAKDREEHHFDFFFDAANQIQRHGQEGAKKDGQSGIYFLESMLCPTKNPMNNGKSIYETVYPGAPNIMLSGDTGNGYRAYEMLEYLSTLREKFGINVELIPLAPG